MSSHPEERVFQALAACSSSGRPGPTAPQLGQYTTDPWTASSYPAPSRPQNGHALKSFFPVMAAPTIQRAGSTRPKLQGWRHDEPRCHRD